MPLCDSLYITICLLILTSTTTFPQAQRRGGGGKAFELSYQGVGMGWVSEASEVSEVSGALKRYTYIYIYISTSSCMGQ
jgi:hypothetical protein